MGTNGSWLLPSSSAADCCCLLPLLPLVPLLGRSMPGAPPPSSLVCDNKEMYAHPIRIYTYMQPAYHVGMAASDVPHSARHSWHNMYSFTSVTGISRSYYEHAATPDSPFRTHIDKTHVTEAQEVLPDCLRIQLHNPHPLDTYLNVLCCCCSCCSCHSHGRCAHHHTGSLGPPWPLLVHSQARRHQRHLRLPLWLGRLLGHCSRGTQHITAWRSSA